MKASNTMAGKGTEELNKMEASVGIFDLLNGAGSLRGVSTPQLIRVNPTAVDLRGLLREPSGGGQGGTVLFTIDGRRPPNSRLSSEQYVHPEK
ncbi:MAG: hypothetical protein K2M62_03310 [Muribaculaceae bacterium]|nr:hypothetical protein [Muribaculaceae bacterium]